MEFRSRPARLTFDPSEFAKSLAAYRWGIQGDVQFDLVSARTVFNVAVDGSPYVAGMELVAFDVYGEPVNRMGRADFL